MQDVLEEYFVYERASGSRLENPTSYDFGYNGITLNMQRTVKLKENVQGRHTEYWETIGDEHLPKRPKQKKNSKHF